MIWVVFVRSLVSCFSIGAIVEIDLIDHRNGVLRELRKKLSTSLKDDPEGSRFSFAPRDLESLSVLGEDQLCRVLGQIDEYTGAALPRNDPLRPFVPGKPKPIYFEFGYRISVSADRRSITIDYLKGDTATKNEAA